MRDGRSRTGSCSPFQIIAGLIGPMVDAGAPDHEVDLVLREILSGMADDAEEAVGHLVPSNTHLRLRPSHN